MLNHTPTDPASFVSSAYAGDPALIRDVDTLVSRPETSERVEQLEQPERSFDSRNPEEHADPLIGRRLGAYQIEREVARGGMGTIYEALRVDREFAKRAAIKIVKRGMDTDVILRRFRKERQILAAFNHPNIASLLDGGTTDDGLPYFVMEYIEGKPLYKYCDANQLSVAQRLQLFLSICDAVHYAHQRQVVHRDIKPSNVLVTADGVPKLLDFGIAKLLNPDILGDITRDSTGTAMRLMTPEYASPEQIQGWPTSPATDVYSLGVLLYELLTGYRPYRLLNRAPHEIARVICEEAPPPPSFVIMRHDDRVTASEATTRQQVYSRRKTTPGCLRKTLSGDLDTIIMRALEKEPENRYQSAKQLRDDIARFLEGKPVSHWRKSPDLTPLASTAETSVAVLLGLMDSSQTTDSGTDYLAIGLTDALISRLSTISRLAVRPVSSVLGYPRDSDPLTAGRKLCVTYVLSGSLRRTGDRIDVTIQLLNVSDGQVIWTEQFDEKLGELLNLEDRVCCRVSETIVPDLTADERIKLSKRGTDNPQAHEAYLRGRYYWNKLNEEGFAHAILCYNQAIALDPNYALAYAGLAAYHNWLGSFTILPSAECAAAAYDAASNAVAIDPTLAEGYAALGQAILWRDFSWARAKRQLLTAIDLDPNYSFARILHSSQLTMEGRFSEALHEAQIAHDLDPMGSISRVNLIRCSYFARRVDDAYRLAKETVEMQPKNLQALLIASSVLSSLGRHEEAIDAAQKCVSLIGKNSHTLSRLGSAQAKAGDTETAQIVLQDMHEIASRRYISPYHLALVNCSLGRVEQTLDLLDQAYESKDGKVLWIAVAPELDVLHGHPRFVELLAKLNHRLSPQVAIQDFSGRDQESVSTTSPTPVTRKTASASGIPAPPALDNAKQEAQQLYTAGRYYSTRRTTEGVWQAIDRLKHAVELDPEFARAHAELADCYALLNWYVEPPPVDAWKLAKQSAINAVTADPKLAEARASLGFVRLHYDRDWEGAERELRVAIQLKPGAQVAHRWYALSLSTMGRHEEALAEMKRAREISPQSAVLATAIANVLFLAGRYDEAIAECRRAMELDSGAVSVHTVLRWCYEKKGMHREALAAFEEERVFAGDSATTRLKRASVLAAVGRCEEARMVLNDVIEHRPVQWVSAYEIAIVYGWLGEMDSAFRWLEQAEREHAIGFTFVRVDPRLEGLRSDPRFESLLRGIDRTLP
ncbi:MAG TPA: protein kinase [Pyrinomonadaceae bacterium]|nr:protein kinase [Pyrinomonadaceae bacterium]